MQKKLNNFLKKEVENIRDIEALTFEHLKKISVENDYYLN
jgi:hypothetical protein